ncbi:MAG: hypothetical protein IJ662_11725, partial [Clostridia bacterium]|nr:hypothetical protein [Clostridia bacterium]
SQRRKEAEGSGAADQANFQIPRFRFAFGSALLGMTKEFILTQNADIPTEMELKAKWSGGIWHS